MMTSYVMQTTAVFVGQPPETTSMHDGHFLDTIRLSDINVKRQSSPMEGE